MRRFGAWLILRCVGCVGCVLCVLLAASAPAFAEPGVALHTCRLRALEHAALCGHLSRPLDPERPLGTHIDLHFVVLPAVARKKKPDPVFFFAGGPGQSAIDLAGQVGALLGRFSNRRDIVLIDQRGTGRSAPLQCGDEPPTMPLRESADVAAQLARLSACRQRLMKLSYGDLRQFTTRIAAQDTDAVRRALGAARIDLVGASYGTRVALDYMRQFPQAVRRVVLDGAVPPDMALPASFSPDVQAAFDAMLGGCEHDTVCASHYPRLRAQWHALLASLPREVVVRHPVTALEEHLTLTREMLAGLVRLPLYVPALASALPLALADAAQGRFTPLFGLASALGGGGGVTLAQGMHFSVICAEDMPRLASSHETPGADFGDAYLALYRKVCADWPRAPVPAAFYTMPPAPAATLILSGGVDPAAPPRHGARVAQALGAKARHVIVAEAGHGLLGLGCMKDVVFRFVDAPSDDEALKVDASCAAALPRPRVFVPVGAGAQP